MLMSWKSCAVGMCNAILKNHLKWNVVKHSLNDFTGNIDLSRSVNPPIKLLYCVLKSHKSPIFFLSVLLYFPYIFFLENGWDVTVTKRIIFCMQVLHNVYVRLGNSRIVSSKSKLYTSFWNQTPPPRLSLLFSKSHLFCSSDVCLEGLVICIDW